MAGFHLCQILPDKGLWSHARNRRVHNLSVVSRHRAWANIISFSHCFHLPPVGFLQQAFFKAPDAGVSQHCRLVVLRVNGCILRDSNQRQSSRAQHQL